MSWVALEKAITQKKNSDPCSQKWVGMVKATPPKAAPMSSCIDVIHQRLVLMRSMNGLHNGFIIHGRFSQPVYNANSVSVSPICIYITAATAVTSTLGSPSAK